MKLYSKSKIGVLYVTLVICIAAMSNTASAAMIGLGSEIGFIGTFSPTGGSGLGDATGLTFPDTGTAIIGSNDFAGQVGGTVTLADLSLGGPLPAGTWFTMSGGLSFALTSLSVDLQTANALDISATGIWSLAGFDDTAGTLVWTGDSLFGGLFTYSASGTVAPERAAVPEPGTLMLLGLGLLGLAAARRRR